MLTSFKFIMKSTVHEWLHSIREWNHRGRRLKNDGFLFSLIVNSKRIRLPCHHCQTWQDSKIENISFCDFRSTSFNPPSLTNLIRLSLKELLWLNIVHELPWWLREYLCANFQPWAYFHQEIINLWENY